MRVFAVILSLLTIFLSSYPCCSETDTLMEISSIHDCFEDRPSEDPDEGETPCSPFYTCGRCSGFTLTYYRVMDFVECEMVIKSNTDYYQALNPKEVYFHDLKPPRNFEV